MAAIDKIYMTDEQGELFWNWMLKHNPECIELTGRSMVDNFYKSENGYITNYPEVIDWYLYNKCELDFIHERLREQYSESPENRFLAVVEFLLNTGVPVEFDDVPDFIRFVRDYAYELKSAVWKRMLEDEYFGE